MIHTLCILQRDLFFNSKAAPYGTARLHKGIINGRVGAGCRGRTRTGDLRVMGPVSCRCSTLPNRDRLTPAGQSKKRSYYDVEQSTAFYPERCTARAQTGSCLALGQKETQKAKAEARERGGTLPKAYVTFPPAFMYTSYHTIRGTFKDIWGQRFNCL